MSIPAARSNTGLPTRSVRLTGPSETLDPRIHAYRGDLADLALADRVIASHYAGPVHARCLVPVAPMRKAPSVEATQVSELLFGEAFAVLERRSDWVWGYGCYDRYVGYVPASAVGEAPAPTHRIAVPQGLVFAAPNIKSPLLATLPLCAEISSSESEGRFRALHTGGYVHERHVGPLTPEHHDPIALAKQYIGTPYLWGGRTRAGIDCSGLIQTVLGACGHPAPRDSDQQRDQLGAAIDPADVREGDLVFFPGHVGIMATDHDLLHANAYWMTTLIEPLADVVARLKPDHDTPITAVRRL